MAIATTRRKLDLANVREATITPMRTTDTAIAARRSRPARPVDVEPCVGPWGAGDLMGFGSLTPRAAPLPCA
jgi:hypothetical protein